MSQLNFPRTKIQLNKLTNNHLMKSSWTLARQFMRPYNSKLPTNNSLTQTLHSSFGTLQDNYEQKKSKEGETTDFKNSETSEKTKQNYREDFKDKVSRNDAYPPEASQHTKLEQMSAPPPLEEKFKGSNQFEDYHDYNVKTLKKIVEKGRETALEEEGMKVEATLVDKAREKVKQTVKKAIGKDIRDPILDKNDPSISNVKNEGQSKSH